MTIGLSQLGVFLKIGSLLRICTEKNALLLLKRTRETGLEPATSAVTGQCSNQLNYSRKMIGYNRTRTYDHLCVRQALYQLSCTPDANEV